MTFKKAEPKQANLKVSMYGPPGSGKTFSALLMAEGLAKQSGKRIAYVDTERGTDFYATGAPGALLHPEAFDFDTIYTRSLSEVLEAVRTFDQAKYGVLCIDSITHIWRAAIDAYEGKKVGKQNDKIPFQAWAAIKRPYKELIDRLLALPAHVFILGRQKNLFDQSEDGELQKVGVGMSAEGETQYEPHLCLHMVGMQQDGQVRMFVEKDRSRVLAGRTYVNPTFATIEPLLPLLGSVQAGSENEEERVAKDGDLLAEQDQKAREKLGKSQVLFADFSARYQTAQTMEEVGAISTEVRKAKRSLAEDHLDALREIVQARTNALMQGAGI